MRTRRVLHANAYMHSGHHAVSVYRPHSRVSLCDEGAGLPKRVNNIDEVAWESPGTQLGSFHQMKVQVWRIRAAGITECSKAVALPYTITDLNWDTSPN